MPDIEFWSADHQYGLQISEKDVSKILSACRQSVNEETGGILVGYYNAVHNCALVTAASGAPPDSKSGHTWFERGISGLQVWLNSLWNKKKQYYLGEWHFHPYSEPAVSLRDVTQLSDIASAESYHCPEPVLLIVGGDPQAVWTTRAFVFPRNLGPLGLELLKTI